MSAMIDDPRKFRVSKSGYSIKTGWGNDSRIVAGYHQPHESPLDNARFQRWLDDAQAMCDAYNAALPPSETQPVCGSHTGHDETCAQPAEHSGPCV